MTFSEIQILLDINKGNEVDVLKKHASWIKHGYFFVDTEDGHCWLFDKNGNLDDLKKITTLCEDYIKKDIKKIVIPKGVKSIGFGAFWICNSLTSIEIPKSVKSIDYGAFQDCVSLTSIEIPDSVESIGDSAFYNCKSLTSIKISKSVKSIGDRAFYNCISLKEVIFKGKTMDKVKAMRWYPWRIKDRSIIRCEKS